MRIPKRRNNKFHLPIGFAKNWNGNGSHVTQIFNALSLFFPLGEEWFIETVRDHQTDITDIELQRAVSAFIGQEAFHRREHELYNKLASDEGLPSLELEKQVEKLLEVFSKKLTKQSKLGITIALEHLTAVMADKFLTDNNYFAGSEESYKKMWIWHALEETEHKCVAFDVYQEVYGKENQAYANRIATYILSNSLFWSMLGIYYLKMIQSSGELSNLYGWSKSFNILFGKPGLIRSIFPELLDYFKKDFHPSDCNNDHLLEMLNGF